VRGRIVVSESGNADVRFGNVVRVPGNTNVRGRNVVSESGIADVRFGNVVRVPGIATVGKELSSSSKELRM
jgi:hypothetical protein